MPCSRSPTPGGASLWSGSTAGSSTLGTPRARSCSTASRPPTTPAAGASSAPDPDGRRLGFPLAGRWTATGEHLPGPGTFGITCTGGATGKCVRYGYKPWGEDAEGRPLWDLHQTCVRLVRADYCGDGVSWTETGTLIDLYDRRGIQARSASATPACRP
ncbi:MAG TPA: ADYC domain-containing protein [Geminicoccaceae bacterium]|nr:ADYC domain-containing protein [Geminicoccaceae bacterium]